MTYKVERELKFLIEDAYFAGLNREVAWEPLMERFNNIVESGNE